MLSYMEYKMITSVPLSGSIYELWKNIGGKTKGMNKLSYSGVFNMAKKMERMGIIRMEKTESNERRISRITEGEQYPVFKRICDEFFGQYYSRATEILKGQVEEIAKEWKLKYEIIGGQMDPSRAYGDLQIAIPEEEMRKWKSALPEIEENLNELGITMEPKKQNRFLIRKLQVIPLPFNDMNKELEEGLEKQTIQDIHYGEHYNELMKYFLHMRTIGNR